MAVRRMSTPSETLYPRELGRTSSDGSGQFRVELPRGSSSRYEEFGAVALAAGYGAGWVDRSTPTPTRPPSKSHFGPSKRSPGACSTCKASPHAT